jgi:hypothetical protein
MEEKLTCISYPQGVSKLDELSVNLTEWSKVAKNRDFIFSKKLVLQPITSEYSIIT